MFSIYNANILLVDDDVIFLEVLKSLLLNEGYQYIIIAKNAQEAFNEIRQLDCVYVITEFNLNEYNGVELIQTYQRISKLAKIIVLSNSTKLSDSFKSMRYGALSFVHKSENNWKDIILDNLRIWITHYNKRESHKLVFNFNNKNQVQIQAQA